MSCIPLILLTLFIEMTKPTADLVRWLCVLCVCVCTHTHTQPHTLELARRELAGKKLEAQMPALAGARHVPSGHGLVQVVPVRILVPPATADGPWQSACSEWALNGADTHADSKGARRLRQPTVTLTQRQNRKKFKHISRNNLKD
jgi:hypothetical protein